MCLHPLQITSNNNNSGINLFDKADGCSMHQVNTMEAPCCVWPVLACLDCWPAALAPDSALLSQLAKGVFQSPRPDIRFPPSRGSLLQ